MRLGDVFRARTFRHYMPRGWADFSAAGIDGGTRKAAEKMVMLFAFVGIEKLVPTENDPPLDIDKLFARLGWIEERHVKTRINAALRQKTVKGTRKVLRALLKEMS